jgi:hypothetical protein
MANRLLPIIEGPFKPLFSRVERDLAALVHIAGSAAIRSLRSGALLLPWLEEPF